MKVTRVEITAYRGVEYADVAIGDSGVLVTGKCESGKTSFLDAISAALVATGVDPSDIRRGHDRAEILVTADSGKSRLQIKRRITASGASLTVSNEDGFKLDSPQTRLRDLLGGGGIDPLTFFLAKDAERRRMILDATPVRVTEEDLARWIPAGEMYPEARPNEHGLETVARVRSHFYGLRTDANKRAKSEAEDAARIEQEAAALAPNRADGLDAKAIEDEAERARAAVLDVEARQKAAAKAKAASGDARAKIDALRKHAILLLESVAAHRPGDDLIREADARLHACRERVARLRADLEAAEAECAAARSTCDGISKAIRDTDLQRNEAKDETARADDLEAALASAAPDVPTAEVIATTEAYNAAVLALDALDAAREEGAVRQKAEGCRSAANAASARAAQLDRIVKTLTDEAPKELAARGNAIPGFDVEAMSLDGVKLDSLSGAQKMEFAVNLAKRAHPEAKMLICDGLERIDRARMETFVAMATAGGWQIIGSRVEDGAIRFEALEPDAAGSVAP